MVFKIYSPTVVAFLALWSCLVTSNPTKVDEIKSGCSLADLEFNNIDQLKSNEISDLVLYDCSLSILPNGTFKQWDLKSLTIVNSNVSVINGDAFGDLENLRYLKIVGNRIKYVQTWSTQDLMKLQEIDLSQNDIGDIDVNALCRYPKLLKLNAEGNAIERLLGGTFKCVPEIIHLNFSNNRILALEAFTFTGLTQLIELSLRNNLIDKINAHTFAPTTNLRVLELNGNQIEAIDCRTFNALLKLNFLNISRNSIIKIEENAFKFNAQLKLLDMSFNQINELSDDDFRGLNSLKVLNVSANKLSRIEPETIVHLVNLVEFIISSNNLTYLREHNFIKNTLLEYINLSNNSIVDIPRNAFLELKSLHAIDLSSNRLSNDEFLNSLHSVKILRLNKNNYTRLNISLLYDIDKVELMGNFWQCSFLIPELIYQRLHRGIQFVVNETQNYKKQFNSVEEIDCYDQNRNNLTTKQNILRHVIVVHSKSEKRCGFLDDTVDEVEQKFNAINTYPRTFNKLLKDEVDIKACLLWTVIGVFMVVALIRLGKYVFDKVEKRDKQLRSAQQIIPLQERTTNEINSCLIQPNDIKKSRT